MVQAISFDDWHAAAECSWKVGAIRRIGGVGVTLLAHNLSGQLIDGCAEPSLVLLIRTRSLSGLRAHPFGTAGIAAPGFNTFTDREHGDD